MRGLGSVAAEERPKVGKMVNEVRSKVEARIADQMKLLEARQLEEKMASEKIDVTLPGRKAAEGHLHPVTLTLREIKRSSCAWALKSPKVLKLKMTILTLRH
ncbi:hypothetical protein M5E89_09125 [Acidaminococcus intestini]|nr:hypothetical protein M5E89_09125 [Acidaminococcus intestini]